MICGERVTKQRAWMNEPRLNSKYFNLSMSLFNMELKGQNVCFLLPTWMGVGRCLLVVERRTKRLDDYGCKEVIPVMLMATMSVGTALAVCLIFSSGVGRGGMTFLHTTCPSTSDPSPPSPSGVWGLMES